MFRVRYFVPTEGGIRFHSEAELTSIDVEGLRYLVADDPPFDAAGEWAIAVTVELPDGQGGEFPTIVVSGERCASWAFSWRRRAWHSHTDD